MPLHAVTVKIDKELRKKMSTLRINWSEYVRNAIRQKIELEERKAVGERLLEDLKRGKCVAPKGFINRTIREMREAR